MNASALVNRSLVRWCWQELRQGQLWLVVMAFVLIIASVFALSAIAQRMDQVIVKQGKDALMADTVFVSANPVPESLIKKAQALGATTSLMTRFSTMLFGGEGMKLVFVKAVDDAFPLRGTLQLSDGHTTRHHVAPDEVWLDPQLLSDLGIKIGDRVSLGDMEHVVSGTITEEPGFSFNPFRQMSTVFIHQSQVPETGALQVGSRVEYQLFINAPDDVLKQLKQQVKLTPSEEWRDVGQRSRTQDIFNKSEQYLSLVVIIIVLMATMTLLLTCQHYVASRRQTVAMLKSLGASKRWVWHWLMVQVSMLIGIALLLGLPLGYGLERLLRLPLIGLLLTPLPELGMTPFVMALLSCLLVAIPGLGIPLYRLIDIEAVASLQNHTQTKHKHIYLWGLWLFPCVGTALYWGNQFMVWLVLGGIVFSSALLAGIGLLLFRGVQALPLNAAFKLALKRVNRTPLATGIQLGALSLSLMLFAALWLVRTDLLSDWSSVFPENAPDVFALNIATHEKDNYLHQLQQMDIAHSPIFPIIRGRLSQINGSDAIEYAGGREASNVLRREVNFTWAEQLPTYNQVVAGHWQPSNGVSIEESVARELGVKVGDQLTFMINSQSVTAQVNSIRQVEWREMKPNFYFIFTPDRLSPLSATWMVSFRLGADASHQLSQLAHAYPTVSLLDLREMTQKIQGLLSQIINAISILAVVGVIAGLLLIYTLLRLSLMQRQEEMKLYRTLGMSRRRLMWTVLAEFGLIAVVAGSVSGFGADAMVAAIIQYAFELTPRVHLLLWVIQPVFAVVMVMLVVGRLIYQLTHSRRSLISALNVE
ncbi:outer membrane-specific lipoprotein transporter subunit LolC [Vibrio ruber DSM 16370]|uniref:Outer membrane-specific lipoprotein transporter subunit LolC n=1 Tax=Vibrio ruber (strain DSM 16370 / JCM 11486 / BCRC 17186 / CECT 7878 / LMG 23124 / VR1) TaxID=1123498 RepID=A0A1R4LS27_VIBR1|nr:FtsX-like permease family protein [Vibrio ruber]SJN59402.1 outer membrane-specific lipoprotein transporter subunit LolC [Vibrio ruber DSM 16370]